MKTIVLGLALLAVACVGEPPEDVAASYEAMSAYAATPHTAARITRIDDETATALEPASAPDATFVDPTLPRRYAPNGIAALDGRVFVAYATTSEIGGGIVSEFAADGGFIARVAQGGSLDAPSGLALAPRSWGRLAGMLLVGSAGNGEIHVFDPRTGAELGVIADSAGAVAIPGLRTLRFDGDALHFDALAADGVLVSGRLELAR